MRNLNIAKDYNRGSQDYKPRSPNRLITLFFLWPDAFPQEILLQAWSSQSLSKLKIQCKKKGRTNLHKITPLPLKTP